MSQRETTTPGAGGSLVLGIKGWHLQLAVPYAIVVSTIYLVGYWSTFRINPLEYADVADILKLASLPLAAVVLLGVVGTTYSVGYWALVKWLNARARPGWRRVGKTAIAVVILTAFFFAPAPYPTATSSAEARAWIFWFWALVSCGTAATGVAYILSGSRLLDSLSTSRLVRATMIGAVVTPLVCGFPLGRLFGSRLLGENCVPITVDQIRSGLAAHGIQQATYLGHLGGHTFVRELATGAIAIERLPEGRPLVLLPSGTRTDGMLSGECKRPRSATSREAAR